MKDVYISIVVVTSSLAFVFLLYFSFRIKALMKEIENIKSKKSGKFKVTKGYYKGKIFTGKELDVCGQKIVRDSNNTAFHSNNLKKIN